jgi:cytochrome c oxidase assembly protein subunit 15
MSRLKAVVRRVRAEGFTPREFMSIAVTALVLLSIIVVSGGAVRLSGSGLGCDDWPNCNNERILDVSNAHAAVEQINRLFTFLVAFGVVLAALAAWYRRPRRRDLLVYSMVMLIGVPAQGLVGAVVIWTNLHPASVQWHFLLSMVLVAASVMMIVRSREPDGGVRVRAVVPRVRARVRLLAVWVAVVVVLGTIVTNTGPHAGDEEAKRFWGTATDINGNALKWITRIHGVSVWIAVAIALSIFWSLRRLPNDRRVLDAPLTAWVVTCIVQGSVGYVQYAAGLPVGLVAVHLAGATALVAITTWLWAVTSKKAESAGELVDRVSRQRRAAATR